MPKSHKFGILLTDAIYRISSCEADKPLSVIHDELGYALEREGGSAIYYWRRGNVPKLRDVENMAKVIIQRCDLGHEWLQLFLESAEHPYAIGLCDEIFPQQTSIVSIEPPSLQTTAPPRAKLPKKMYNQFVGRSHLASEVIATLADSNGQWMVSIDGIGGIGKTALAYEIAATAIKRQLFNQIVWVDVRKERGKAGEHGRDQDFSFENVLGCIANQLGEPDIDQLSLSEKELHIRSLLEIQKTLIIIDGLENATESQTNISRKLDPLLGISKALLISRYRFTGDIYTVHLCGLEINDAIQFIRQKAKQRRMKRVETAKEEELERIALSTGGSPLAMKLVLSQLEHLPIETVLKHLCQAEPLNNDLSRDEYFSLYRSIYSSSWNQLSNEGKGLLLAVIQHSSNTDISLDMLRSVCTSLTDDDLTRCINELWQFSFMDTIESVSTSLGQVQYNLHALTRYFVPSSDVIQM